MNHIQSAAKELAAAIDHLRKAQRELILAKSDQRFRLTLAFAEIKEIHDILVDPECTPEMIDLNVKVEPVTDIDFIVDRINKSISEVFERKPQD